MTKMNDWGQKTDVNWWFRNLFEQMSRTKYIFLVVLIAIHHVTTAPNQTLSGAPGFGLGL